MTDSKDIQNFLEHQTYCILKDTLHDNGISYHFVLNIFFIITLSKLSIYFLNIFRHRKDIYDNILKIYKFNCHSNFGSIKTS